MVTGGNRETNWLVTMVAVKTNSVKHLFYSRTHIPCLSNVEKEKLVIDLYYNQGKNVSEIAQEATKYHFAISVPFFEKGSSESWNYNNNG